MRREDSLGSFEFIDPEPEPPSHCPGSPAAAAPRPWHPADPLAHTDLISFEELCGRQGMSLSGEELRIYAVWGTVGPYCDGAYPDLICYGLHAGYGSRM